MIVGQTGSGKSVTWKMLKKTLTQLHKEKKGSQYQIVRVCMAHFVSGQPILFWAARFMHCLLSQDFPINPKSLSLGELYGEFELSTNEWTDGVLSSVMRQTCIGKLARQLDTPLYDVQSH